MSRLVLGGKPSRSYIYTINEAHYSIQYAIGRVNVKIEKQESGNKDTQDVGQNTTQTTNRSSLFLAMREMVI